MAQITASLVKELRDKSGAGMMDCKKALIENDGDIEASIDWLRQKGISKAEKKSGRVAAEGLVAVASNGLCAIAVEVNSESDFVARNEQFQALVKTVAEVALAKGGDYDATKSATYTGSSNSVEAQIIETIGNLGENMNFRRSRGLSVSSGVVSTYIHNAVAPGLGKLAVLVALESNAPVATLDGLGKQLAMHIAATNPQSMTIADMDPAAVEREKAILIEQARDSGKPEEIIEKMIIGRMNKFYQEVVFVEQTFVIDGETKISKVVENAAKEAGTDIKLTGYVRLELGAGIEKTVDNFAAEVAAAVNS